ncbi:MAG: hypothetical protein AAF449_07585, partial [Myxococcota bacterium]
RIEKAALKRTRRALASRLEAAEELAQKQLGYAETLLENNDPATLVAVLLDMAKGDLPREAIELRTLAPRADDGFAPRKSGGRGFHGARRGPRGRGGPRRFGGGRRRFQRSGAPRG